MSFLAQSVELKPPGVDTQFQMSQDKNRHNKFNANFETSAATVSRFFQLLKLLPKTTADSAGRRRRSTLQ